MTEHPIIFSGPMIRSILEGRKTMTRRVLRFQNFDGFSNYAPGVIWTGVDPHRIIECPYGRPGDRMWVREAWLHDPPQGPHGQFQAPDWCHYKATAGPFGDLAKWKPPIHMPRWASRLLLEVTDVRCERLQEITEEDAIAEGIEPLFTPAQVKQRPELGCDPMPWLNYLWHGHFGSYGNGNKKSNTWPHQFSSYKTARGSFSSLWQRINVKNHPWESNPWVWVISFKVVDTRGK